MVNKFKYNDKARVVNTNDVVDVIDVIPEITPTGIRISYKVHNVSKGFGTIPESLLEKIE